MQTARSEMDVSKVAAECQESDENDGLSSLKEKGNVMNDLGKNILKFSCLKGPKHVYISRKMEWHEGC